MDSTVLVKAFSLIEALADGSNGLGQLAGATGLAKPTAHRILQSLVSLQYVEPLGEGRYRLTRRVRQLSMTLDDRALAAALRPVLERLRVATGETVNLGVLRANRVLYLSVLETAMPWRRAVVAVNDDDPVFTTALGRAIASRLAPDALERLLFTAAPERRTPRTITDADRLRQILIEARRLGIAFERDQTDLGTTCLAAPVFSHGEVVAAISISGPSTRAVGMEEQWVSALRRTVVEAERELASGRERVA